MKFIIKYRMYEGMGNYGPLLSFETNASNEHEAEGNFHDSMRDSEEYYKIVYIKKVD